MKVESNSEGNTASCYCLFQAGRQLCLLNILKSSYLFLFYFRCHVSFGFHLLEVCFLQILSIFYIGSWKCQSLNINSFHPFSHFFCLNIYSSQFVYKKTARSQWKMFLLHCCHCHLVENVYGHVCMYFSC